MNRSERRRAASLPRRQQRQPSEQATPPVPLCYVCELLPSTHFIIQTDQGGNVDKAHPLCGECYGEVAERRPDLIGRVKQVDPAFLFGGKAGGE